jgi:DNA-binding LytR/AlgR family response regulator
MGNFSKLHTLQKKHMVLVSLKNIEPQLPAGDFMRIHKQYIINLHHMVSLSSEGEVQLSSGHNIPVGDMYKAALVDIINKKVLVR